MTDGGYELIGMSRLGSVEREDAHELCFALGIKILETKMIPGPLLMLIQRGAAFIEAAQARNRQ